MFKKLLVSTASAATIMLAACGGGGGSDVVPNTGGNGNNGGGNNTPPPTQYNVAGPLDAVQAPVSDTVFGSLEDATDGTPLKALLACTDRTINHDALDIADTIANALQSAAAAGTADATALAATAGALNSSVNQLALDLQGLLNSLAGLGGGCGSNGQPVGGALGSNPLAGTPLSSLATELQGILLTIKNVHPGSGGTTLSLSQLSTYTATLSTQIDAGMAAVNAVAPEVSGTPMINGALVSVQQMLHDVEVLMAAVTQLDSAAVKTSINTLLDNALSNQLTRAVPLRFVEQQAGQVGLFSLPVQAGTTNVADVFTGALGTVFTTQALKDQLTTEFAPVLGPIADEVLPVLSTQIVAALHNAGAETGPTGTPLDSSLGAVTDLLALGGGVGGQPVLDLIVGSVQTVLPGGLPVCPSTNPILNLLCGL